MAEQNAVGTSEDAEARLPWLKFRLREQLYAVYSQSIISISTLPEDICALPQADKSMIGIFFLRERTVPLYDLRKLVGQPTLDDEDQAFTVMLEQRKQDHLHWTNVLEQCVADGTPFPLATDPHQCAFGRWLDHYSSDSSSITHHLGKLDEPHRLLHQAGEEVMACAQEPDGSVREERLRDVLKRVRAEYVPRIVGLLDEAKDIFHTSFQEMVVVLERDGELLGLVVDEVLSVESIGEHSELPALDAGGLSGSFAHEVALDAGGGGERVLLIDQEPLFALLQGEPGLP